MNFITKIIIGTVVVIGLLISCSKNATGDIIRQVNHKLVVEDLRGNTFDLSKNLGKVSVVIFWSTDCVPCLYEIPNLHTFYEKYHHGGVELIAIAFESLKSDVLKKMKNYNYPVALSSSIKVNSFGDPRSFPIAYVIDSRGTLKKKLDGFNGAALEEVVKVLLVK
jgi:thiol-disulfide isomerase/thioredoxin